MWLIVPRWQSISSQAIKSHLRDAPRDTHGATADYDDTTLGTGTLTVHPWRAGPDCGKLLLYDKRPLPTALCSGKTLFQFVHFFFSSYVH